MPVAEKKLGLPILGQDLAQPKDWEKSKLSAWGRPGIGLNQHVRINRGRQRGVLMLGSPRAYEVLVDCRNASAGLRLRSGLVSSPRP